MRRLFAALQLGDRIEIEHTVLVGSRQWTSATTGTVLAKQRRRHGLHYQRNPDDRVWSDVILVQRGDGERTTVTIDEFTRLRKIEGDL